MADDLAKTLRSIHRPTAREWGGSMGGGLKGFRLKAEDLQGNPVIPAKAGIQKRP